MPKKRTAGIRGTVGKRNGRTGANSSTSRSRPTPRAGATNKRRVVTKRTGPQSYSTRVVGTKTDRTKPKTVPGATNRSAPTNRISNTVWRVPGNATVRGASFPGGTAWVNEAWPARPSGARYYNTRTPSPWPPKR